MDRKSESSIKKLDEIGFEMIKLIAIREIKRSEGAANPDSYAKLLQILPFKRILFALPIPVLASREFPLARKRTALLSFRNQHMTTVKRNACSSYTFFHAMIIASRMKGR